MIPQIETYRFAGEPARALIKIVGPMLPGETITINGDVYTHNVDFFGEYEGKQSASLVAAIRGELDRPHLSANANVFRQYSAYYVGPSIVVYASAPGTAGNAFTLATSAPGKVTLSGAVFTAGGGPSLPPADGTTTTSSATSAGTTAITAGGVAQTALAANANRKWFLFQNISDTNMWIRFGNTATGDTPSIKILPDGSYENPSHFRPTGLISVFCATTGKKFVALEG